MKRLIILLIISALAIPSFAASPAIRNIDIKVNLQQDGSAKITEVWDVTVASGTEWYLVNNNLGDIMIEDLIVKDETGLVYENEGSWDVDRTIGQKAGRCGLNETSNGYEICWGVGSYGDHIYTVSYTKTNFVKSLNDYDAFNHMFITPGLSSKPEHAKVTIEKEGAIFDTTQVRIAAFGFIGTINFVDGKIVAESSEQFRDNSSMIVLARFEKGIFIPTSIEERDFSDMEQRAMAGSDYETKEEQSFVDKFLTVLGGFFMFGIPALITLLYTCTQTKGPARKGIFGVRPNDNNIQWCRELPYNGNLYATYFVLKKAKMLPQKNSIASALVLRMLMEGDISLSKDKKNKTLITFNDKEINDKYQDRLYNYIKQASGRDKILQNKEFLTWAKKNYGNIKSWVADVDKEGQAVLKKQGFQLQNATLFASGKFDESGQEMARKMLGFKKYLENFTIINERKAVEVALWRDYLLFASLFGIADKVANELKDIDSTAFEDSMKLDNDNFNGSFSIMDIMLLSNAMSRSVTAGADYTVPSTTSSSWGGGGSSSFGGGGGFSGGGFGGGSR